jgi:hypothetical protein
MDRGDFLTFSVEERAAGATIEGAGVVYDGFRFDAQAHLAGRSYGSRFGIDIAFGDRVVGAPDTIAAPDALDFIGVPAPVVPTYPIGSHLAEKLHAFTLPRERNGRLKDLIDIALVASEPRLRSVSGLSAAHMRDAITATFAFRNSHPPPTSLSRPPPEWTARYPKARKVDQLPWPSLDDVHATAAGFLDPVLAGVDGTWDAASQRWLA